MQKVQSIKMQRAKLHKVKQKVERKTGVNRRNREDIIKRAIIINHPMKQWLDPLFIHSAESFTHFDNFLLLHQKP